MTKKNEDKTDEKELPAVEVEVEQPDGSVQSFTGSGQKMVLVKANVGSFGLAVGEKGAVPDDIESQLAIKNGYLTPVEPAQGDVQS